MLFKLITTNEEHTFDELPSTAEVVRALEVGNLKEFYCIQSTGEKIDCTSIIGTMLVMEYNNHQKFIASVSDFKTKVLDEFDSLI